MKSTAPGIKTPVPVASGFTNWRPCRRWPRGWRLRILQSVWPGSRLFPVRTFCALFAQSTMVDHHVVSVDDGYVRFGQAKYSAGSTLTASRSRRAWNDMPSMYITHGEESVAIKSS
jgi:hypothetical protein